MFYGHYGLVIVVVIFLGVLENCKSQIVITYSGKIEIPSLKCVLKPTLIDYDSNTRKVCFCTYSLPYPPYTPPAYHCIFGDGKATFDDIRWAADIIRNTTSSSPPGGAKKNNVPKKKEKPKKVEPVKDESTQNSESEEKSAEQTTTTTTTEKPKSSKGKVTVPSLGGLTRRASNSGFGSLFGLA